MLDVRRDLASGVIGVRVDERALARHHAGGTSARMRLDERLLAGFARVIGVACSAAASVTKPSIAIVLEHLAPTPRMTAGAPFYNNRGVVITWYAIARENLP